MGEEKKYDVVIIGGSYAGLSAAMTLGRAIRKVLVIDGGKPCNRQTPHSHNFLTQDGNTPAAIAALGKTQVMAYPTIEFADDEVIAVTGQDNSFVVYTAAELKIETKKLLFTTGIKDQMPVISGFAECWGISVIHCPYCHGYEYKGVATGLLANGDTAVEFAKVISNWTAELTIYTNGKSAISSANQELLSAMGIAVVEQPIVEVRHHHGELNALLFADGTSAEITALYARIPFEQHCKLPGDLGCAINESGYIQVDELQKTSVAGVYAAGDNSTGFRAVSGAVAAGSKAAAMLNHELISQKGTFK